MTSAPTATRTGAAPAVDSLALAAIALGERSALIKQLPVLALFIVAAVLSLALPTITISSPVAFAAAIAMMLVATVLAAVFHRTDVSDRAVLLVPAIDFAVVGVLRFATGESASIFASLAILPAVWIAAMPGRRFVVWAFLGVALGQLVPFLLGSSLEENPNELARTVFSAVAFGLAAAIVNDLARVARQHVADIASRERSTLLELEHASTVQRALLPKAGTHVADFGLAAVCVPSRAIGGDFFDWYDTAGGTAFTVGDVMGKGVGAGIIAATVRAVVRSARGERDLSVAVERASEALAADLGDAGAFATLFHARVDPLTGVVRYVDAGHGLSIVVRADGTWTRLPSRNLPVGIPVDEPWVVEELELAASEALVVCSDGVLELFEGDVGALGRIADLVAAERNADAVVGRIRALARDSDPDDDVTVLVLRRDAGDA